MCTSRPAWPCRNTRSRKYEPDFPETHRSKRSFFEYDNYFYTLNAKMAVDVLSVPVFLVVFRESLETVIIVSVLLAFFKADIRAR